MSSKASLKKLEKLLTDDFVRIDYVGIEGEDDFCFGKIKDFFIYDNSFYLCFSHEVKLKNQSIIVEENSSKDYFVIKEFKKILSGTEGEIIEELNKYIGKLKISMASNNQKWYTTTKLGFKPSE